MDTLSKERMNEKKLSLTWDDIYARVKRIPKHAKVFGIPRGGAIVAGLTGRAVSTPEEADIIIDDIIDSGRTYDLWKKRFPCKQFIAVVNKRAEGLLGQWVHFPWEEEPHKDIEDSVVRLLEYLGEDPSREGLKDTPKRVVKAWGEMTAGYRLDPKDILAREFDGHGYDQMVLCRSIEFNSTCEHHMLPFMGVAHVGYIPDKSVVGLSKMARLVDCFARRLQIQEKMTTEIARAMHQHLKPKGVGVTVVAKHLCMSCRGVQKHRSEMVTTQLIGKFKSHAVREEFFMQCRT